MAGKNYSAEERAQYWKDRALKGNSSIRVRVQNLQGLRTENLQVLDCNIFQRGVKQN